MRNQILLIDALKKVLKNGVRELAIYITNSKYRLPNILLSVSVLKTLVICGCKLPSSLMFDAVKFKALIKLSLVSVPIDDEVIKHLTTSCPLLQEFEIDSCGLQRVCVYGHQNLQSVYIQCNAAVERIDIEAPNLYSLRIINEDGTGAPQMNLASCKKPTTVSYFGYLLPNSNGFTNFVSNFPFVENLYLAISYKCKNLKLSSHSLRTLMLPSKCDFEEIEFNTPNLALLGYPCNYASFWPMVRRSTHLKACMQCYPDDGIDALWFQKLRLFLDKKNGFKVLNLYIEVSIFDQSSMKNFIELEKLKVIELPPYELDHVELKLDAREESSAHVAFVEAVLWCCRPQSLTLRSSVPFEEQSDVVKFTYKKLLEQDDQGHTKIQIVSPSSAEAQKHLMDLKSLSMASPREGKAISFIKEEEVKRLQSVDHICRHLQLKRWIKSLQSARRRLFVF
ncbi:putative leucine-rich repeat domain superfamily [Helianthus debilis subsp. tardiflorus]